MLCVGAASFSYYFVLKSQFWFIKFIALFISPTTDSTESMMLVWWLRGKIIRTIVCCVLTMCVCLYAGYTMSCAKLCQPIQMPSGMKTQVLPSIRWGPDPWAAEVGGGGRACPPPLQYLWGPSMLLAPPGKC